jgi:hypothetical protein
MWIGLTIVGSGVVAGVTARAASSRSTDPPVIGYDPSHDVKHVPPANFNNKDPRFGPPRNVAPVPFPPGPVGILPETGNPPYPPQEYQFNNEWAGVIGDTYVRVLAGWSTTDEAQGVIAVVRFARAGDLSSTNAVNSPDRVGAFVIESVAGSLLNVRSATGRLLQFDPSLGRFVS